MELVGWVSASRRSGRSVDGAVILSFEDRDGRLKASGTTRTIYEVLPVPSAPKS